MTSALALPGRIEAEDYLFHEADLIDTWALDDWAGLFTEDGEYFVPALDDPDGEPGRSLFFVYDNRHRLAERAKRLLKPAAHAEFPRSKIQHLIGNVRVVPSDLGDARFLCNFIVYRSRNDHTEVFPGRAVHDVVRADGQWKIRRKRAVVATDTLRDQGRLSFIL
ncbi:aromatic-ring-hydroxylating dioxygenase subunit beta [Verticiella sediminum]|nr:aromatic-ring-hydroxylating dioxygenase subunit beta [Verticiella sediminum]